MKGTEHKSFIKNVITLFSGNVIAQVISLVALPFLQKYIYGPVAFANFIWFFEFASVFVAASSLRMEMGIIKESDDLNAIRLTKICIKIVFITSIISFIASLLLSNINPNFHLILGGYWRFTLIPVAVFLLGNQQVLNSWFTRQEHFALMSKTKVTQNSTTIIGQTVLGKLSFHYLGLTLGRIIGLLANNLYLFWGFIRNENWKIKHTRNQQKQLITKNKDFIKYSTPSTFLGTLINFLIIDLFIQFYGEQIAGEIGSAKHYLGIAFALISISFSQVFFARISKINTKKELHQSYTYWLKRLSIFGLMVITLSYAIPNTWITFILGNKWENLLPSIRIMSLWMSVMFVSSSLSHMYIRLNRQRQLVIFDIIHLITLVLSIYIPHVNGLGHLKALYSMTFTQIAYYLLAIFAAYFFISRYKEIEN